MSLTFGVPYHERLVDTALYLADLLPRGKARQGEEATTKHQRHGILSFVALSERGWGQDDPHAFSSLHPREDRSIIWSRVPLATVPVVVSHGSWKALRLATMHLQDHALLSCMTKELPASRTQSDTNEWLWQDSHRGHQCKTNASMSTAIVKMMHTQIPRMARDKQWHL